MKTLRLQKRGLHMVAADPYSEEIIDGLNPGKVYKVEVKEDRSRGDLNLYWAGLGFLVRNYTGPDPMMVRIGDVEIDAATAWPTSRKYHEAMLEATGYVSKLWRIDGTFRLVPDSIALDAMTDDDFKPLFERIAAITVSLFGYDPWAEWKADKAERDAENERLKAQFREQEARRAQA